MKHKYIMKMHYENSKGYWARLPDILDGVIQPHRYQKYHMFFPKRKGTWKAALELALDYRDSYLKENNALHFLTTNNNKNNARPRHNYSGNTSGVIGVAMTQTTKSSGTYFHYTAMYSKAGEQFKKTFSINLYGEKGAFKKACEIRYENAGKLIITDRQQIPCLPKQKYIIQ